MFGLFVCLSQWWSVADSRTNKNARWDYISRIFNNLDISTQFNDFLKVFVGIRFDRIHPRFVRWDWLAIVQVDHRIGFEKLPSFLLDKKSIFIEDGLELCLCFAFSVCVLCSVLCAIAVYVGCMCDLVISVRVLCLSHNNLVNYS